MRTKTILSDWIDAAKWELYLLLDEVALAASVVAGTVLTLGVLVAIGVL